MVEGLEFRIWGLPVGLYLPTVQQELPLEKTH